MKAVFRFTQFLFVACLALTTTVFADVKIKSRTTMQGQTYENTTYIKGKRQRTEQNMGGMETVNITQCDLKRSLQVMPMSKAYMVTLFDEGNTAGQPSTNSTTSAPVTKGGFINVTYTNKDTGERKQMFGYTARRIISTIVTESSPDACTQTKSKMEIDAWYIDAAFALNCDYGYTGGYSATGKKSGCQDRYNTKTIGSPKTGYPVYTKTTMFDDKGGATYSMINEVTELSAASLEASLFDAPAGYREVKNAAELYSSMAMGNMTQGDDDDNSGAKPSNQTSTASTTVGAKKAGVIRIGLIGVKTGDVGEGVSGDDLAEAVRNSFTAQVKAPNVELVQIGAKQPGAILEEAKQKDCDYLVYATVSHKKGKSGGFGGMFKKIAPSLTGAMQTESENNAGNAALSGIKAKDEITLVYQLIQKGGTSSLLNNTLTAKAKSDGEDVISPLIQQAAQAIVSAAK